MNSLEKIDPRVGLPGQDGEKEISSKEKITARERDISVEIERRVMEKYAPLLNKYLNRSLTPEQTKIEWIKKYAVDYRALFDKHKNKILELYENDPESAADYIEEEIEGLAV